MLVSWKGVNSVEKGKGYLINESIIDKIDGWASQEGRRSQRKKETGNRARNDLASEKSNFIAVLGELATRKLVKGARREIRFRDNDCTWLLAPIMAKFSPDKARLGCVSRNSINLFNIYRCVSIFELIMINFNRSLSFSLLCFSDFQKLEREARICRKLQHPNIGEYSSFLIP